MAYAQRNYSQKLGSGPTTVTIADGGCFLTAFSNLLERYEEEVAPPDLNDYFNQHNVYLQDDEDKDFLSWGSISVYDTQITVTTTGKTGWPDRDNAIVKFIYKNQRTGQQVLHFCLVADHNGGTIVDSWDGVTKRSPYGTPVAWAVYERHVAQVIPPPPPVEVPSYTVEQIPERLEVLKIDSHLWDLNQRSWPGLVNNPITAVVAGTQFKTTAIAHHVIGGSYYMLDPNTAQGYNIVDCGDVVLPPPPSVVNPTSSLPTAPITAPSTEPYEVVRTVLGYTTSNLAINRTGNTTNVPSGIYYVFNRRDGAVNVTKTPGLPGTWINEADNVLYEAPAPVPLASPAPDWRSSYTPYTDISGNPTPKRYVALLTQDVTDQEDPTKVVPLKQYSFIVLSGTFIKDGLTYGRPLQATTLNPPRWYSVKLGKDYLESYDQLFTAQTTLESRKATHTLKPTDYLILNFDKIVKFAGKIEKVWDIFPSKNKKKTK